MKRKRSVTQGSVQRNRKRILTGNANTSGRNVQATNSSRTSGQVSTGNARVSRPFWNNRTEEISRRLWLPARYLFFLFIFYFNKKLIKNTNINTFIKKIG